jgi:outer membrane receptor protein involved in Fe transport
LSGRGALELSDGATEIAIVGRNLLDREYFSNAIDLTASLGTTLRYYAPGRTLAVELRRAF